MQHGCKERKQRSGKAVVMSSRRSGGGPCQLTCRSWYVYFQVLAVISKIKKIRYRYRTLPQIIPSNNHLVSVQQQSHPYCMLVSTENKGFGFRSTARSGPCLKECQDGVSSQSVRPITALPIRIWAWPSRSGLISPIM